MTSQIQLQVDSSEAATAQARSATPALKAVAAGATLALLSAAFSFLGEIVPQGDETEQTRQMAASIKERLADCLEKDGDGGLQLTVTLPDPAALDALAGSLSRWLTASG